MVMARMTSGVAVIGDSQLLPGYSLLLVGDEATNHPTDLPWDRRRDFFFDLALLGEAVFNATRPAGAIRVNYAIAGNAWPHLHGHVHPRYEWEEPDNARGPIWGYAKDMRNAPEHAYNHARHGRLREQITKELHRVMANAYGALNIG